MKFQSIQKRLEGKYIHRYDIMYALEDGSTKVYEMISRNPDIQSHDDLIAKKPDAVVLIMHDETGQKVLLNKEFRLATGVWIYNFPAGLIDEGETPDESAKRELWEETGLTLQSIDDHIPLSYSAIGFSNETNVCVVGTAAGSFRESTSAVEEIVPGWFTKEEVRELLAKYPFAARTQAYCYAWSRK
jgi:ADP-ribose pyrophosphatase